MVGIVADMKAMLQSHAEIDLNATLIVNFNQLAASSLDVLIYTFTKTVVSYGCSSIKPSRTCC